MVYSNTEVRRQDRLLEAKEAEVLLKDGEYAVLSMKAENGVGAYAVPISFVWDGANSIYFHCAKEGQKLRCLDLCNSVSVCIVGKTKVHSEKFTTAYESIMLTCKAYRGLAEDKRMQALELLLLKYSPLDKEVGMEYAKAAFERTEIVRLDIETWSGKSKVV